MSVEINPTTGLLLQVLGPSLELLTSPDDDQNDFCLMRGIIPPGVVIPLHSHADTEDFVVLLGRMQALKYESADNYTWIEVKVGEYLHVPSNAPHAFRNVSNEPVVVLAVGTRKLTRFFVDVGNVLSFPPTPKDIAHFLTISAEYGYWNATPEENAAVGIQLAFAN
jgi:quercetin dioxygenase-like cupin family protein